MYKKMLYLFTLLRKKDLIFHKQPNNLFAKFQDKTLALVHVFLHYKKRGFDFINWPNELFAKFQEKALALAESRALPALYCSTDIRPLNIEDFRYAHEQV